MKKIAAAFLKIIGSLFFLAALMFGYYSVIAYIERSRFGAGLFFTDAEIFLILTFLLIFLGLLSLWISNKIKEHPAPKS